jgi:hypothetical protein
MLGTVTGATSNSSCVVCPPSSTCAIGTTTPQDLTLLADQSGLTAFASADAFLASYLPSRASRSLRASVPGLDTDETRARIGADANNGQADPTGTLPSSSGRLLSDYQNSLIIVALSVMCIVPLLFFRCIPDGLARWSDAFAILILPNPRRGAKLDTR